MAYFKIDGRQRIEGKIKVHGAKNAVLPIMAATLLSAEPCLIHSVPSTLEDVLMMKQILEAAGAQIQQEEDTMFIDFATVSNWEAPYELVSKMRASFVVLGPMLARIGQAKIPMPGGCAIGSRPVDLHLKGMQALGAEISLSNGYVHAKAARLKGNQIYLDFPSVGATQNIMMAATLAEGSTVIENAAAEPEISDLATFLSSCGAHIHGAGTDVIRVEGVRQLHGCQHEVIPDRIEAGTFLIAAAITGGDVFVEGAVSQHMKPVLAKLREVGCLIQDQREGIRIQGPVKLLPTHVTTLPHPGFPTDMQAQMMALLTLAEGNSLITETVFENRFQHTEELMRMGANIRIDGRTAFLQGVRQLTGAQVQVTDLRAGAALVLAGMAAEGETRVHQIYHIDRGYVKLEEKLRGIGAAIQRVES
ncbi:MAG: UDP-N-acetylglucosamine 1-carboxyvinyltransferase [Negativicutes bacterium]|nr:UDP-N-acetylglucosamine 1-carboxyvinyltransferase [Negativicutes bacterium]